MAETTTEQGANLVHLKLLYGQMMRIQHTGIYRTWLRKYCLQSQVGSGGFCDSFINI